MGQIDAQNENLDRGLENPPIAWLRDATGTLIFFKHNHDLYSDEIADADDEIVVLKATVRLERKWIVAIPIDRELINEPRADDSTLGHLNEEALYAAQNQERHILAGHVEK